MHVAVLGTGIMGSGMAANLARAGHEVTVWNRTREKADQLAARDGVDVRVADSAAEAADGVDAVVTMVFDRAAVEATCTGPSGAFEAGGTPLWVQSSTVGTEVDGLVEAAGDVGWRFVDAPVLGTRGPAEEGGLTTLVAGAPDDREAAAPLFDAWGKRTVVAGDRPGPASRLKLVVNSWLGGLLASLAESVTAARRLGVDPAQFLDTIEGSAIFAPYARIKGDTMVAGEYPPQFPLAGLAKDLDLVLGAATGGPPLGGLESARHWAQLAMDAGLGEADMAAIVEAMQA